MFDPRWNDDPRDRDEGSRDRSRGSRGGGSDPRDRDRPDPRDVFVAHVDLPRGRDREHVHHRGHDYTLRGSESRALSAVGAFRVIPASDLRDTFDKPLDPRHGELWHLREGGLVQTVRIDRDTTVVTLTREGRDLLESRRWDRQPDAPDRDRQAFHDGIQRPRELKHDAELYRAYLEEAERLHEMGAEIYRVVLENDLKAEYQEFLQERNRDRDDSDGRHNRAQLYHLNKRSLYAAIGQATSRLQRPLPLNQAIHRLMVLDAIVEDPEMIWLGTNEDKASHLAALTSIAPEQLPHATSGIGERRTVRYFPDRLPIGIQLAGRGVLVYVVLDPTLNDFRLFLERHAAVLRALRAWTVRVVIPMQFQHFDGLAQRVKQAFFTQLVVPAFSEARIEKIRQRFKDRRTQIYPFDFGPTDQYVEDRDYLAAPRYHVLFKMWKTEGDVALAGLASGAIHAAVESGAGQVETLELGHRYGHLSPLASIS